MQAHMYTYTCRCMHTHLLPTTIHGFFFNCLSLLLFSNNRFSFSLSDKDSFLSHTLSASLETSSRHSGEYGSVSRGYDTASGLARLNTRRVLLLLSSSKLGSGEVGGLLKEQSDCCRFTLVFLLLLLRTALLPLPLDARIGVLSCNGDLHNKHY